jgi:hypothetical protein
MRFILLDLVSLATGETFFCNFFIPFDVLPTSLETLVFFIGNVFCVFPLVLNGEVDHLSWVTYSLSVFFYSVQIKVSLCANKIRRKPV